MATTTKVFNIAGGKHSAEAYSAFEGLLYGSCVASGLTTTKSSSNMNCFINSGAGLIKVGTTYARRFAIEGGTLTVTVSAASTTLARRDTIVLYVDNSVTPTTSVEDNTNNILKGMVVAGTPAQNPAAPNATTIQSAVGAGNPYIVLYDILVPANATNLSTATLYDRRLMAVKAIVDAIPNSSITRAMIDPDVFTYSTSEKAVGTWIDGKTIYRKVVHFGAAPNNTTKSVAHGISSLSNVVKIDGYAKNNNNQFYPIPLLYANSAYNTQIYVDSTNINMINTADRSVYDCYVILEYTKS